MNLMFLHLKNLIIYVLGVQIANPTIYYFLDQVLVNTPRWSYLLWI